MRDDYQIDSEPDDGEPADKPRSGRFHMTMTYGVVPDFDTFMVAWEDHFGGDNYSFVLVGEDARAAARCGVPPEDDATPRKLYSYIQGLTNGWEEDGDEQAGSLASGFLMTLGFEWV